MRCNWLFRIFKAYIVAISIACFSLPASADFPLTDDNKNKCESTDVVFAIDTTYSLSSTIYDIKKELDDLLDLMMHVSDGKLRLGLVTFKDQLFIEEDLNDLPNINAKMDMIEDKIDAIVAKGGGGGPEASDEALNTILHALPAEGRRQDLDYNGRFVGDTRIIILITDNLPGGFDDKFRKGEDDENAASRALEAADQNVLISAIYTPTSYFERLEAAENILRDYALTTGGLYIRINASGQGAAQAVADIINACGNRPLV